MTLLFQKILIPLIKQRQIINKFDLATDNKNYYNSRNVRNDILRIGFEPVVVHVSWGTFRDVVLHDDLHFAVPMLKVNAPILENREVLKLGNFTEKFQLRH